MNNFFNLKIYTPEQILFDGTAEYLSATNSIGEFGILPGHTSFSSDIIAGDLKIKSIDETEKKFSNGPGIVSVKSNQVILALESGNLIS